MELLVLVVILGVIPAAIAQSKGRSFIGWWIYGALLFIIALPHALLMKRDAGELGRKAVESGEGRQCPFCAEMIKAEATVCKHCHRDLPPLTVEEQRRVTERAHQGMM